jgi:hypothetical protein
MKTFKNCAAQGEVYILRVKSLPKNTKPVESEQGKFILGHSESGHHHVIERTPNVQYFTADEPLVTYLQVIEATDEAEVVLEHLRSFDTHESIKFDAGIYKIINARESSPEGWRKVAD